MSVVSSIQSRFQNHNPIYYNLGITEKPHYKFFELFFSSSLVHVAMWTAERFQHGLVVDFVLVNWRRCRIGRVPHDLVFVIQVGAFIGDLNLIGRVSDFIL